MSAGKVFLYKNTGSNAWQYMKEVVPQPTGGFDELKHDFKGGWLGVRVECVPPVHLVCLCLCLSLLVFFWCCRFLVFLRTLSFM